MRAALAIFAAVACLAATSRAASGAIAPVVLFHAPDTLELRSGYVRATFNLTRGSFDALQGRFLGDGDFSASPNLAGCQESPTGTQRGAFGVTIYGLSGHEVSTASFDRASPLPYTIVANDSSAAAFSVTLTDDPTNPRVKASVTFTLSASSPRALQVASSAVALSTFQASVVSVVNAFAPPNVVVWYDRGVRQGMAMAGGYLSSQSPLRRYYTTGDGSTGAVEIVPVGTDGWTASSFIYAATGLYNTNGALGLTLFGAPAPFDGGWNGGFNDAPTTTINQGTVSSIAMYSVYPNDYSFPPSQVPPTLPPATNITDLRSILTAVHGAVVSALHSYDFYPEVRAAPCLVHSDLQCYAPLYNFYDPDSGISNSAMLYSFDADVAAQVRGQLETNMRFVCGNESRALCAPGQCIHHFTGDCSGGGSCVCSTSPQGVQDCVLYDAISGAVQTGPNIFTLLAALRYAGTTGDADFLVTHATTLRAMMAFLDELFDASVGLYNAPGSLQIDVFIRQNYTADSNAMAVLLCELYADAEDFLNNTAAADFYRQRANTVRAAMNVQLMAASNDHYCTQSDPMGNGGVARCTRDFVDYDANSIAVAARVPNSTAAANRILARMDSGVCTHAGRATYVSEKYYDAANCVGGNTGDSAVSMGRIAWQDAMARHAVGDAHAQQVFSDVILSPLQHDLLRRSWLPERYTCQGQDTHNSYYFEYPATVALLLYEVKYGISIQMTQVIVDPLTARNFDYAMGELWIGYYNGTAFHAQLTKRHSGTRQFHVTRMQPGTYTVKPSYANAFTVQVEDDGVLSFSASVGSGLFVDASHN